MNRRNFVSMGFAVAAGGSALTLRATPSQELDRPGRLDSLYFDSHGELLYARVFVPDAPGRVVLLLHGCPGAELNLDIAHALRRAGYCVFVPHYRGSWGMPGAFSFANVVEDAGAAITYIGSRPFAEKFGTVRSLSLAGHSLGGFAALQNAARFASVDSVASVAGFNFGLWAREARRTPALNVERDWAESVRPLAGTSASELASEALAAPPTWDLTTLVEALHAKPALLVAASDDAAAPRALHHAPLVESLRRTNARVSEAILPTGHDFASARLQLIDELVTWLRATHR